MRTYLFLLTFLATLGLAAPTSTESEYIPKERHILQMNRANGCSQDTAVSRSAMIAREEQGANENQGNIKWNSKDVVVADGF
ncbi:hypothetical protein N7447_005193 [Penicillium robsamsonii]|uniref:uncharacterized protein n=1 Tax=Penicillium robsamsonii TaxID=1792511 RepID=UPI002548908B|nr:uncharacterized protein N7447_005193 [Penicillium robsamsonii]KAJ5822853.1 hypothetical protein N7447_005193 [Penicillium robsamsonii]